MTKNYSLYKTLADYVFSSEEQKAALADLMRQAPILQPSQSIKDKFPNQDHYDNSDILNFVQLTQEYFTISSAHQERWEVKPHVWMSENQLVNLKLLEILGITAEIDPVSQTVDATCILGATMNHMQVDYAVFFNQNYDMDAVGNIHNTDDGGL